MSKTKIVAKVLKKHIWPPNVMSQGIGRDGNCVYCGHPLTPETATEIIDKMALEICEALDG